MFMNLPNQMYDKTPTVTCKSGPCSKSQYDYEGWPTVTCKPIKLHLGRVDCEMKKIVNTVMNVDVNLEKKIMTIEDAINKVDRICVCLDRKKIIN